MKKKIPQVVAFLFYCALGNCIVGLNKDVPVQMCCIRTKKSMQNFIFRVGIFWWKLCLPIFALCVGVLIIAICCDCLTVSLQYGFWVAFWDKKHFV